MSFAAHVYKVMLSGPSDVDAERAIIRQAIADWNTAHAEESSVLLVPVSWHTDVAPSMEAPAQDIINEQLVDGCDLLIAVFWNRVGTPTTQSRSGTIEEIELTSGGANTQ